jgi:uncharacterized protein (TIGR00730 family)
MRLTSDRGIDETISDASGGFVRALGTSSLQRPYEGFSQLVNHIAGSQVLPKLRIVDAPAAPKTDAEAAAQYAGNLIGGALPYLLLRSHVGAGPAQELALAGKLDAASMKLPLAKAAAAGALFDVALDPVQDDQHFWRHKFASAAATAASMSVLTASQMKLKSLDLPALRNDAVSGAISGLPAGFLAANVKSGIDNGKFADASEDLQASLGTALSGGLLGGANSLKNFLRPVNGIEGATSVADLTRLNDSSVTTGREPSPFLHVIREVDSPISIKESLADQIHFLTPSSRQIITSSAADLTASHEALNPLGPRVAFFGSARRGEGDFSYQRTRWLSNQLAKQGYVIVNGGGPGIMEAASRGAFEAGGTAVGLRAELPFFEPPNKYVDIATTHRDISSRIEALAKLPDAFVVEEGGIGTDLEAMMVLQLMQMHHLKPKPFYFVDVEHGNAIRNTLLRQADKGLLKHEDLNLFKVTGNVQQIANELAAHKPILDIEYAKHLEEHPQSANTVLPRRHTVARVSGVPGNFQFSDFLAATPADILNIKPSPSILRQ